MRHSRTYGTAGAISIRRKLMKVTYIERERDIQRDEDENEDG
jgi:hypothetical protein